MNVIHTNHTVHTCMHYTLAVQYTYRCTMQYLYSMYSTTHIKRVDIPCSLDGYNVRVLIEYPKCNRTVVLACSRGQWRQNICVCVRVRARVCVGTCKWAVLGSLLLKSNHTTYYILRFIYVIRYSYILLNIKCN